MEGGGEEEKRGGVMSVAKTPDKCKRDEWNEEGVMTLLDVYEVKWLLRNRAKLKGSDWEDIAQQVSGRNCGTKPVKTPNQCKNKVEAMKKRYRMESAVNNHSGSGQSWQFYARMDKLVKGTHCLQPMVGDVAANGVAEMGSLQDLPNLVGDLENDTKREDDIGPVHVQVVEKAQTCKTVDINGQDHIQDSNREDHDATNMVHDNSEFSTPINKAAKVGDGSLKMNSFKRRKRLGSNVVAESIGVLAHSMLKIEQARMEMYRDSERLRAEADIKRAEMDLKRTEIIATTQLQIAKLFVKSTCNHSNKIGDSPLSAEHIVTPNSEQIQQRNG